MRSLVNNQRKALSVIRRPIWFLLLFAVIIHPAALPANDPLLRAIDSLASPSFAADLAGTPAELTKEPLPAPVVAESPDHASLPKAALTCRASLLPAAVQRPSSSRLSPPSLPRAPPPF